MKNKALYWAAFVVAAVWADAAGAAAGISEAPTPSHPPSAPAVLGPLMSVAEPTYARGSGHLTLYKAINGLRAQLGVGLLAQDAWLDRAAQAHAIYLSSNNVAQHDESAENPDFYDVSPLLRGRKAGAPTDQWVGEVVGAARGPNDSEIGQRCFEQWLHTVYHLQSLVTNQESVGIGFSARGALGLNLCVLDFGTRTDAQPYPAPNGVPYGGGQHFDAGKFITVPSSGDRDVQVGFNFAGESPHPAPDIEHPGRPLMVYANGASAEVLSVIAFKLVNGNGTEVPARVLVSHSAKANGSIGVADAYIRNNAAFLLPVAPLAARETYSATFSGLRAGKPVSLSWSFKTGATSVSW
ncbi:CAP domain-containing protein [Cupriavidus pauculus]|uniref:SCP domain-containing protein n=1 Tax=Cupriavidus pauculus TaxID=82633 RepID=A0A2N5CDM9_9BURK|nr:CAP domain-containing protein [Cupriavidus pauculus]PLQ00298.1 hypothetical protein CYJ10_11650 [Cupriavidus pauculus]